ncbi:MAG TPA: hypothetical protein VLD37_07135 [Candidatus Bilamarchaeum sp.]|nr:hypothetical protein [Candidatus Bilamarchaeum sp.]
MNSHANPGLAYGVFKCSDSRPAPALLSRFKEALENIRLAHEETKVPPELDFFVIPLPHILPALRMNGADAEFTGKAEALQRKGANYLIQASLPGGTNRQAAEELGFVFNCLYGGTELFEAENEGRAPLVMDVLFKDEGGRFVSKLELDLQ